MSSSSCLHQGTVPHGESNTNTPALGREMSGRVRQGWQAWAELAIRSSSPPAELAPLHHPGSSLMLPGWSCGARKPCLTCRALFDLAEKPNPVFPELPVTASRCCSHQYKNKKWIKVCWVKRVLAGDWFTLSAEISRAWLCFATLWDVAAGLGTDPMLQPSLEQSSSPTCCYLQLLLETSASN